MCDCHLERKEDQERSVDPLIKVSKAEDISKISNTYVRQYVEKLFHHLIDVYKEECTDGNLDSVGAIFCVEAKEKFLQPELFGLVNPVTESSFEYIDEIGEGFSVGTIITNNSFAITIISATTNFERI